MSISSIRHPGRRAVTIALAVAAAALGAFIVILSGDSSSADEEHPGNGLSQARPVSEFARVELAAAAKVAVRVGPATRTVVVRADEDVLPLIRTQVRGGTLVVSESEDLSARGPIEVEITAPSLRSAELSGAGELTVAGVRATAFRATLSGAGLLDVDGTASQLDAVVAGTGVARLEHLLTELTRASVTGAGAAFVHATSSLEASVTGMGSITYSGHPTRVEKSVSGVGSISEA